MKTYTKQQVRNYLIRYQGLCDESDLKDDQDICDFVKKVGCIQFDPLDAAGRNADLVLQARMKNYRRDELYRSLYDNRQLFDCWDKNMSICSVMDWPCFEPFRERYRPWLKKHEATVQEVTEYLRIHEWACSTDMESSERVTWHYGEQSLVRAILECMCYSGDAIVHHKVGTRRYYGLAEHWIDADIYQKPCPFQSVQDYHEWLVLRRVNSVGCLWDRPSDAFLGIYDFKSADRKEALKRLCEKGILISFQVTDISAVFYIDRSSMPLLEEDAELHSRNMRILAPLDNMLWDRRMIEALFDFRYRWEVYVPAKQRQYGYYVMPLLYRDMLVGRIELKTDRATSTLIVKRVWWEKQSYANRYDKTLNRCLKRFLTYNRCTQLVFEQEELQNG